MEASSSFINAIIGTEIMSCVICLILLAGNRLENKRQSKRARWFHAFVLAEMVGCSCDAVSWILDGRPELISVLYISTICSMVMTMAMFGIFVSYLSVYIRERQEISNIPEIIGWATVAVGVLGTVIGSVTGNLFTFENGVFAEKPLYHVYVVVNTLYMVIGIAIVNVYRKALVRYERMAAFAYMIIPMVSAAGSLLVDGWDFSYPAIAVSILILYIILQSDRVKILEREGTITSYQATHDGLTGLNNRTVYQDRVDRMKATEGNSGVLFSDLNGLKYTNDTQGHEAGDRLLVRYAQLLAGIFRTNEIYRISGDEFICVMENVPEEVFQKRFHELKSILEKENPPLACVGGAYGRNRDIETLIRNAENSMYEEKEIIHERFPQMKR